jgi:DNA-binding MarR family transcriptional regulator
MFGSFRRLRDRQFDSMLSYMTKRQHSVKRSVPRSPERTTPAPADETRATGKRGPEPAARTPAGDAFSLLAIQVLRLGAMLTAAGDALAAPAGQTSARWQVLAGAENAPITVAQIARRLGLTRQSVQRIADLLERDGLAAYDDNPDDQRAMLLRLTPRGRSALAAIQRAQRAWADALGAKIGDADLRRANDVLDRALAALGTANGG